MHMPNRLTNLTLLQTYGSNAWKVHNYRMEEAAKSMEKAVEEMREQTVEVNRERKNDQVCPPFSVGVSHLFR